MFKSKTLLTISTDESHVKLKSQVSDSGSLTDMKRVWPVELVAALLAGVGRSRLFLALMRLVVVFLHGCLEDAGEVAESAVDHLDAVEPSHVETEDLPGGALGGADVAHEVVFLIVVLGQAELGGDLSVDLLSPGSRGEDSEAGAERG